MRVDWYIFISNKMEYKVPIRITPTGIIPGHCQVPSVINNRNDWQLEDFSENLGIDIENVTGMDQPPFGEPYFPFAAAGVPCKHDSSLNYPHVSNSLQAQVPSSNAINSSSSVKELKVEKEICSSGSSFQNILQNQNTSYLAVTEDRFVTAQGNASGKGPSLIACQNKSISLIPSIPTSLVDINNCRFQYVLASATSIATKINEETLTYLNQGQPYEIKLKKLGDLSAYKGKILKSTIRLCFHERRLQFMEQELISNWQSAHVNAERLLEVDLPLSYGIANVDQEPNLVNIVHFNWDPTKEVGVYIKVNCISTEFTPNKHGGEKGVPFRIQVETYLQDGNELRRLHSAACQIKVFKLKGADRKHKQDKEKLLKRSQSEREKYQPPYECTVLNDLSPEALYQTPLSPPMSPGLVSANYIPSAAVTYNQARSPASSICSGSVHSANAPTQRDGCGSPNLTNSEYLKIRSLNIIPYSDQLIASSEEKQSFITPLTRHATIHQVSVWLHNNGFSSHINTLSGYSGEELLRLSREDLTLLCGAKDGIRLYVINHKRLEPHRTIYICLENWSAFQALYLYDRTLTCYEMKLKLSQMMSVSVEQIRNIFVQGPGGIHVEVNDEVVNNFDDKAAFNVEIQHGQSDQCSILLKPLSAT